jgi:hypothetical protein
LKWGNGFFLKLQPYVQSSLAPRAHQKLSFKFFGTYKILAKIGSVAYKLDLPAHSYIHSVFHVSIHPVFHVSLLNKWVKPYVPVASQLPGSVAMYQVPKEVLDSRVVARGNNQVSVVRVKWSPMERELTTWEDKEHLMQQFPNALGWGQAGSQGRGSVSSPDGGAASAAKTEEDVGANVKPRRTRKPNSRVIGLDWAK